MRSEAGLNVGVATRLLLIGPMLAITASVGLVLAVAAYLHAMWGELRSAPRWVLRG